LAPKKGSVRNTLGMALYRNGQWREAIEALQKSKELLPGSGGYNELFLAMAYWQLGDKAQAKKWYAQAVMAVGENSTQAAELRRFRAEAAQLLGIPQEPKPKQPEGASGLKAPGENTGPSVSKERQP